MLFSIEWRSNNFNRVKGNMKMEIEIKEASKNTISSIGYLSILKKRIIQKSAVVGVIGLGYVGLPLLLRFAHMGYSVIGIDIDEEKISLLNQGKSYLQHILSEEIALLKRKIIATSDFSLISSVDAIIICVPTPLNRYREPDLSFVLDTVDSVLPFIKEGQIVSLESTTYPGTTEEELKPRFKNQGFHIGENLFLVYSPEREDPGNKYYVTETIPKVLGADSQACLEAGKILYSSVIRKVVTVSSTRAAEMTKLLENIHRSVNIGLVNEMKILMDKMDINIHEVIDAASTKPFGFVPYYPGPGIGGHCIPIDPFYLTWKAREYGVHTRFIELAGEINNFMPEWVSNKVSDALNKENKSIKGSKILVLGIAYKRNIGDTRESPSVEIMKILHEKGAIVAYSDPYVPFFPRMRAIHFNLASEVLTEEKVRLYDCLILATAHDNFDYEMIARSGKLVVDTRGVFNRIKQPNIVGA